MQLIVHYSHLIHLKEMKAKVTFYLKSLHHHYSKSFILVTIVALSRLAYRKGLDLLAAVIPIICKKYSQVLTNASLLCYKN